MCEVLETAINLKINSLLIIARSISEQALSLLLMKQNREKIHAVAVKNPGLNIDDHRESLEDLRVLASGRVFIQIAGDNLRNIRASDFGYARRAWADHQYFGISAGKGDPRLLRQHINALRTAFKNSKDNKLRRRLQERIGKLMGGSAILWIGDASPTTAQARKELAETAEARVVPCAVGLFRVGRLPSWDVKATIEKYHQAVDTVNRQRITSWLQRSRPQSVRCL
jgi:chaperonin GroEL (HSP60 family)